jgi:hypothetical protein
MAVIIMKQSDDKEVAVIWLAQQRLTVPMASKKFYFFRIYKICATNIQWL